MADRKPKDPPACTKCGEAGVDVKWDTGLQLWRARCTKTFYSYSGVPRKSPHEAFTHLGWILKFIEKYGNS